MASQPPPDLSHPVHGLILHPEVTNNHAPSTISTSLTPTPHLSSLLPRTSPHPLIPTNNPLTLTLCFQCIDPTTFSLLPLSAYSLIRLHNLLPFPLPFLHSSHTPSSWLKATLQLDCPHTLNVFKEKHRTSGGTVRPPTPILHVSSLAHSFSTPMEKIFTSFLPFLILS